MSFKTVKKVLDLYPEGEALDRALADGVISKLEYTHAKVALKQCHPAYIGGLCRGDHNDDGHIEKRIYRATFVRDESFLINQAAHLLADWISKEMNNE